MLIGEVARLASLSKDGVRHYEQMGLITSTPRTAGSRIYRDYDASVLQAIENVRQMQQLGFTLKEIGPLFEAYAAAAPLPQSTIMEFLEARLVVIREKIADMQVIEAHICRKLATYRSSEVGSSSVSASAPGITNGSRRGTP
jgi:MerR family copper efflux transcriptional regulator